MTFEYYITNTIKFYLSLLRKPPIFVHLRDSIREVFTGMQGMQGIMNHQFRIPFLACIPVNKVFLAYLAVVKKKVRIDFSDKQLEGSI